MRSFMAAAVLVLVVTQPRATREPLRLLRAIALPGVEGRIDHLTLDPTGQLAVPHRGAQRAEIRVYEVKD
jgi:hypothetical protein